MIDFAEQLEDRVRAIVTTAVGNVADAPDYVKTFSDHLYDVEIQNLPFVVVTTRSNELEDQEVGTQFDNRLWTVHIYYLDITTTYEEGKNRRSKLLSKIERALNTDRRLGNLEVVDGLGYREYVFDSKISSVLFDASGQEEYYSFVSELYLNVYTARS